MQNLVVRCEAKIKVCTVFCPPRGWVEVIYMTRAAWVLTHRRHRSGRLRGQGVYWSAASKRPRDLRLRHVWDGGPSDYGQADDYKSVITWCKSFCCDRRTFIMWLDLFSPSIMSITSSIHTNFADCKGAGSSAFWDLHFRTIDLRYVKGARMAPGIP